MKLAYFVHDLTDPAVTRRVRMLRAGGAEPVVIGFRRAETAPEAIEGCPVVDLGRTHDARLGHRAKMTLRAALASRRLRDFVHGAEVVMARTLEMLAVAEAARWTCGLRAALIYECLDIHRVLVGDTVKGYALRSLERRLMRRASLLVVSSPAFLDAYFRPIQGLGDDIHTPTLLLENKVLDLEGAETARRPPPGPGPPWKIGWLGAIRCARSLDFLTDLVRRRPDLLELHIHGRPARSEFADFDGQVAGAPGVSFAGAYTPSHLPRLYGEVHFSWAIDFMEEGLNSSWLLPNRVYESGRYGAVPIALEGVETGRWLAARGFGVRLSEPSEFEGFLERLTPAAYADLRADLAAVPLSAFSADSSDCRRLVGGLKEPGEAVGSNGQAIESSKPRLAA